MSQRFRAAARLRQRAEFTAVQSSGRRVAGRYLTLLGQRNGREWDRLGIVASRRVGGAVARNRAKRRIRELFRRCQTGLPMAAHYDLVVIARPDLVDAPFSAVAADFHAALGKLRGAR